jgi:hypothetical protein
MEVKNKKIVKKKKPVFDMHGASHLRTICEVLREINDMHQGCSGHDKSTRKKLREAQLMAKKMSNKLLDYNKEIFSDWWEDNPDYEKDLRKRINSGYLQGE